MIIKNGVTRFGCNTKSIEAVRFMKKLLFLRTLESRDLLIL